MLSISGQSIDGKTQAEVRSLIGSAPRPLMLRVALPIDGENSVSGGSPPTQRSDALAYPIGARVYVRRASGLETPGVVHSWDAQHRVYSIAVGSPP